MTDLQQAKALLHDGGYTCVLCRGDICYTATARGVAPLVSRYEQRCDLSGFCAADKVVGRATAFLYVLHGVRAVYADVISGEALAVLREHGIHAEYTVLVDRIVNRRADGLCPFESAVLDIDDPEQAYRCIRRTMQDMQIDIHM